MRRVCFVIVLVFAAVSLSAQNRQSQPTFRSGAAYIRVDMYATRDGKSIDDIQANEVEILEDGVPQKIEAFEQVRVRTGVPQELRVEPNTVEQSRRMAGDPLRTAVEATPGAETCRPEMDAAAAAAHRLVGGFRARGFVRVSCRDDKAATLP